MRRLAALAVLAVSLPAAAEPLQRWTFCIATGAGSDEVFMSEVFAAGARSERLEGAFAKAVEKLGASSSSSLCASPRADRAVALRALIGVEAVDRARGATLRAVATSDFPGANPFSPQGGEKVTALKARADEGRGRVAAAANRPAPHPDPLPAGGEREATAGSGAPDQVNRKRAPGATDCTACGRKATMQVPPARRTEG